MPSMSFGRHSLVPCARRDLRHGGGLLQAQSEAFPWASQALCAQPPHDELTWVLEPGNGNEPPGSVVKLFEICRECPVRAECLRDALESSFDAFGAWGGTIRSERHRVMTVISSSEEMQYADTRSEHIEHAFELLYDTLEARLNGWRHLAELRRAERARTAPERNRRTLERKLERRAASRLRALRPAGSSCRTCDMPFTWRTRADARFCSPRCRQSAHRARVSQRVA